MKVSEFLLRVLRDLEIAEKDKQWSTPRYVAGRIFPKDHPGWRRSCKCGPNGSHRGSGLVLFMGGYLGKLRRDDLVHQGRDRSNVLTNKGRELLDKS